jgi:multidrug resistance efflux pump
MVSVGTARRPRLALLALGAIALGGAGLAPSSADGRRAEARGVTAERRAFVRTVRLSGQTAAARFQTIAAPRLQSPDTGTLLVTRLVPSGRRVKAGEVLVELDRTPLERTVLDRRAEHRDALQQLRRREAELEVERAQEATERHRAESGVQISRLELRRNEALPRLDAERNEQAHDEAVAHHEHVVRSHAQRRRMAEADLITLRSRAAAAEEALREAEGDVQSLTIRSPIDGLALLSPVFRDGFRELAVGDSVPAGEMFLKVVDTAVMQVRARANQADRPALAVGQPVLSRLPAYPDLALPGRIESIAPIATGPLRVRSFEVTVSIAGADARLMPDLSAAVDVEVLRVPDAVVVPRDAVAREGNEAVVSLPGALGPVRRAVRLGAMSDLEVVVLAGLDAGETVLRPGVRPAGAAPVAAPDAAAPLEARGEIEAARKADVTVPFTLPSDTTILSLLAAGTRVRKGDTIARLDPSPLQPLLEEARSAVATAEADLKRGEAEARLQDESDRTARMNAERDVERARFETKRGELVSLIEAQQQRLRLADAELALREAQERIHAGAAARAADLESRRMNRDKALRQRERAEAAAAAMTLVAPADGVLILRGNGRVRSAGGSSPEFKAGDTVWPGATLAQLPDLSSLRLHAQVDEIDRSRLAVGLTASVRVDALPDARLTARLVEIGALARLDFSQAPPAKSFDAILSLDAADPRLRPGMGATARLDAPRPAEAPR